MRLTIKNCNEKREKRLVKQILHIFKWYLKGQDGKDILKKRSSANNAMHENDL